MRFEVLGPIRVVHDEAAPGLVSDLRRRLLAVLLVRANRSVSMELLAEALWDDAPPGNPGKSLHVHVHRLRQALDRPDRLVGVPGGYLLEVGPDELDAVVFARTHERARRTVADGDLDAAVTGFREALALWRSAPYEDVDDPHVVGPEARRLAEVRLIAREELYDAELARGGAREIVPELTELVAEFPLREKFAGQLMHALYRSGRQARALATYQATRRRLAETLNVQPGRELRALYEAVRAEDPSLLHDRQEPATPVAEARPTTPSQLPPAPGAFLGRAAELAELDQVANTTDGAGLVVVTGMAGIGKTSLAVRYAHRIAERFGDGRLYLDLRGHSPEPALNPLEALERLLRGLGAEHGRMPATVEEATAQYRSLMADRKMLLLLDNAASAEQVRPLLPGAPGCLTLITSRNRLSGLVAREGAHRIGLGALPVEDARTLLARLLGSERVDADPDQTAALIEACARLPLALRIAAAQLADEPRRPVREYLAELDESGLDVLVLDDDKHAAVGSAFDLSYQRLELEARRLFRLLGLVPGLDFTVSAAAATSRTTPPRARELIRSLTGAHLLEEHAPGRYRFHDLLRSYARHRAETEESAEARTDALDRLCAWYCRGKSAASVRLVPWSLEPRPSLPDDVPETSFASEREAIAWLEAEFDNIVAAIRHAMGNGLPHWAWHLASGAVTDMRRRGRATDVLAIVQEATDAARAADDRLAIAVMLAQLGMVRTTFGLPVPDEFVDEMLACAEAAEDPSVHGYCLYMAGVVMRRSNLDVASEYLERALEAQVAAGNATMQAMTLLYLGNVEYWRGDLRRAADALERLLGLPADLPPIVTAQAMVNFSHMLLALGRPDRVPGLWDRIEEILARVDDPDASSNLACTRGGWYRDTGRYDEALEQLALAKRSADEADIPALRGSACNEEGLLHLVLGDVAAARAEFEQSARYTSSPSLRKFRSPANRGLALCDLAGSALSTAQSHAREAIRVAEGADRVQEAEALVTLAHVELALDRPRDAIGHAEQALVIQRETGHFLGQARAHQVLGEAYTATSEPGREHLREALRMFEAFGSPAAADVEKLLSG